MTLRFKFVLPLNAILVLVLGASLAWEWRRSGEAGLAALRVRLEEEARFIAAAHATYGESPRFARFLAAFCHAVDAAASPEHQVAVVGPGGAILARAPTHARRPMDPRHLASAGEGSWAASAAGDSYLVRVHADGDRRVIVAESTRAVRERLRASLRRLAAWYGGLGLLLLGVVNVVMRRAVLRPVRRLSRAARLLGQGRLGVQVDVATDDELGALGQRFNAMSSALAEHAEASRRELEAARRVQEHLLPPPIVRLGGVEVAGRCLPAGPVGGDLYDVRPLPGGRVGLLVADLSGHNVAAALHTAMVRAIAWREAEQASTPGEALARMNERLCRDLPEEHFATAFLGWFDPHAGRLRYANAGHPNAYLRHAAGQVAELDVTGPILGVVPEAAYEDQQLDIEPDSLLLAYTDGITEAWDRAGTLWGTRELVALLTSAERPEPSALVGRLLERLAAFREGDTRQDDATIVVARYRPEDGAAGQCASQSQIGDSAEEAGAPVHARPASAPAPWAGRGRTTMSADRKTLAVVGTLALGAILALGAPAARAQGPAPGASPAFYYPSAGYYATTAGPVYIPAPGYYNVPANYAATPPTVYAPAPRSSYPGPGYGYGYGYWPSPGHSAYGAPRGGGGPNNPPYYSGAQHTLHGRGWDSGSHGR